MQSSGTGKSDVREFTDFSNILSREQYSLLRSNEKERTLWLENAMKSNKKQLCQSWHATTDARGRDFVGMHINYRPLQGFVAPYAF